VVPARNEAGNIAPLVEEIVQALSALTPNEIIYVNDGSRDETEAELKSLMKIHSCLRQIRHDVSCGQSAAVRSGVVAARAPTVATLDGDGQNDPAFLPALVAALERDPMVGLAAGQRVGRKATAPAIPDAGSRRSAARSFWHSLISTRCTGSCRRWCDARATGSPTWMWSIGHDCTASRIMVYGIGYGSAFSISRACGG
jgi:glycosyltransferase involved in cell wall biosynthesis